MTGIITNIQPFATHDGPGIRTTVFFKGCQLACKWCCNPETQGSPKVEHGKLVTRQPFFWGHEIELDELVKLLLKDRQFYDTSGGGVTLSGGDPLYQPDFVYALCERLKAEEIHVAMDTYGHCSAELIRSFTEVVDLWLYDIKSLNYRKHMEFTGVSHLPSLTNLINLSKLGKRIWARIAIIPGFNDSEEDVLLISSFLKQWEIRPEKISLFPYHVYGTGKYEILGRTYEMTRSNLSDQDIMFAYDILSQDFNVEIGS